MLSVRPSDVGQTYPPGHANEVAQEVRDGGGSAKQKFYKPIPKRRERAKSWLIRFVMNETQVDNSKVASFVTVKSPLSLSLRGAVKVVIPGKKLLLPPQSDIDFFKRSKFMIESVATNERTTGRGTRTKPPLRDQYFMRVWHAALRFLRNWSGAPSLSSSSRCAVGCRRRAMRTDGGGESRV